MKRAFVRAAEHLKVTSSNIIDQYQEGEVKDPAEAKAKLWGAIQGAFVDLAPRAYKNVLWVRVSCPPDEVRQIFEVLGDATISSLVLGPREPEQPAVVYATAHAGNSLIAADLVQQIKDRGFLVRDWSFGCTRR